ncbi:MAG: porphobilinogen synthase [Candidatus Omnitrophica bacterium]|nr:porphobilinogen synthase [Candidatus Omnitrophota bacterium]
MANAHSYKPSRLRRAESLRSLVRETRLDKESLIMPLFFKEGKAAEAIPSMPGISKMPETVLLKEIEALDKLGIKAVLLFGAANGKDESGSASYDEKSAFHKAIRAIKRTSDIVLIADVCLCAYTSHGHCGIVDKKGAKIDHQKTLDALAKIAVSYAEAGVDMVAPSAMTDGQVKSIREALDKNDFGETAIMSYSVKYASSFYGPFRDIYKSSPVFGDRKSYQMDPGNKREALREAMLDVKEGADIVMVKPALAYLDIIGAVREKVDVPVAAYNVSGEYSMVKAAQLKGWLDEKTVALEMLNSIKRAGADMIITYWAKEAAQWI